MTSTGHKVKTVLGSMATERGVELFTRAILPEAHTDESEYGHICVMLHGYGDHSGEPFSLVAGAIVESGVPCFALDHMGFGQSGGVFGAVPSMDVLADDVREFAGKMCAKYGVGAETRVVVYGESMGGALAILVARPPQLSFGKLDGVVLSAPMIKIDDSLRPPAWQIAVLRKMKYFMPNAAVVPTDDGPTLIAKCCKNEELRKVMLEDKRRYKGKVRICTADEFLRVTDLIQAEMDKFDVPFLILHGSDDVVTSPEFSQQFYDRTASTDKRIHVYEGMWHALSGEPDRERVWADIVAWIHRHGGNAPPAAATASGAAEA